MAHSQHNFVQKEWIKTCSSIQYIYWSCLYCLSWIFKLKCDFLKYFIKMFTLIMRNNHLLYFCTQGIYLTWLTLALVQALFQHWVYLPGSTVGSLQIKSTSDYKAVKKEGKRIFKLYLVFRCKLSIFWRIKRILIP